jgi:hypothetical protein
MDIYNSEHYPDLTAAIAIERVMRPPASGREADENGLRRLAAAMVTRAVYDYADLVRCPYRCKELLQEKRELEAFFLSDWFRLASGRNGADVLQELRREVLRRDRA